MVWGGRKNAGCGFALLSSHSQFGQEIAMRTVLALVILVLAPVLGHTSDNSCLERVKLELVNGTVDLPAPVLANLGIENATGVVKSDLVFSREFTNSEFNNPTEFEFSYRAKAGGRLLKTSFQIKPTNSDSKESLFLVTESYIILTPALVKIMAYERELTYGPDCSPKESATVQRELKNNGHDFDLIITKNTLGAQQEQLHLKKSKAEILLTSIFDWCDGTDEAIAMLAKQPKGPLSIVDGSGRTWTSPSVTSMEYRVRDPIAKKIVTLQGQKLMLDDGQGIVLEYAFLKSPMSPFQVLYISTGGGRYSVFNESMLKDDWLTSGFSKLFQMSTKVTGFVNEDFGLPSLDYRITTAKPLRLYSNYSQYFTAENDGSNSLKVHVEAHTIAPHTIPWNAPVQKDDLPYLKGSHYVQLGKVKNFTDALIPLLAGKTRLEAAQSIASVISQLITYNVDVFDTGKAAPQTTEQILATKTGVCTDYSTLFLAIARSLGIPAREVYGLFIGANEIGNHAWVEFKVDDSTWWPMDPQANVGYIESRSYFPIIVSSSVERQEGGPEISWDDYYAEIAFLGVQITKIVTPTH